MTEDVMKTEGLTASSHGLSPALRAQEKPFWVGEFGITKQALHDIDSAIGGKYELADGRKFWIDGATVREIMRRITPFIGAEIERHRLMAEHNQPRGLSASEGASPEAVISINERSALLKCEEALRASKFWFEGRLSGKAQGGTTSEMLASISAALTLLDEVRK